MKIPAKISLLVLLALLAAGCGQRNAPKVIGREPPDAVFQRALAALERESWTEAIDILERIPVEYPGYARLQEVRLRTGDAYMGRKEYITAAGAYVRLAGDYPAGQYADDARFGACEAYVRLSPDVQRDQQYTQAAVEHCEALAAAYPTSEFTPRAQQYAAEMREKLAEKLYIGGEFYRKNDAFDSSIIYYEDVLTRYPRSVAARKSLLRLFEVYTRIGYADEAQAARERLLREFPDSPEARAVQNVPPTTGA